MNSNIKFGSSEEEQHQSDQTECQVIVKMRHFFGKFKLRTVITTSLVFIVVLAIGITGFLALSNCQYAVEEISGELQASISDRIVQHLDSYLEIPHLVNALCQDDIRIGGIKVDDINSQIMYFKALSYRFPTVESICYGNDLDGNYTIISTVAGTGSVNGTDRFLGLSNKETGFSFEQFRIDEKGRVLEKTLTIPDYDPRTRPWYQAAVAGQGPTWTPIYMWLEGVVSIDAVVPVYSEERNLIGVLDTALTLEGIGDFLESLQISRNGQAFIIERSGNIIASSSMKEPFVQNDDELVRLSVHNTTDPVLERISHYLTHHISGTEEIRTREQIICDYSGERTYVEITPYQDKYGLDWLILVIIPEDDLMGKINENNRVTTLLIIISIIGTILVCILLAQWITGPVLSMNKSARALAKGDWTSWTDLDRDDELGELSHSFKNMAEQLQATFASLKASEERYISLFQSSADAILLFNGYDLVKINQAGEEMFGITETEASGKDVHHLFEDIGHTISEMIGSFMEYPEEGYQDRTISRVSKEKTVFLNIRANLVPADDRTLTLVHIRDITEQRQAIISFAEREALRDSFAHIEMILHLLPDPTFVIDKEGRVLFWNKALERMTGVSSEEIRGKGDMEYSKAFHEDKRPILIDFVLTPDMSYEGLYPYVDQSGDIIQTSLWARRSGEMKYLSVIAACLRDKNGDVFGAIESIRDITSHKMAEEGLLIANKKLNLLSSITRHDIINKVTISKGHLSLLQDTPLNKEQQYSLSAIEQSMDAIEHFIAFARTYQELGLRAPFWQDVGMLFTRAAREVDTRDIVVNNTISEISILADPLFEKVCYNLIENAVRHGIHITRIDITAEETEEGLRISVADDGKGIPDELKETIFQRGYGSNTGYGLFLAREILEISGITITERGKYQTSCRFDLDIPKGRYQRDDAE